MTTISYRQWLRTINLYIDAYLSRGMSLDDMPAEADDLLYWYEDGVAPSIAAERLWTLMKEDRHDPDERRC